MIRDQKYLRAIRSCRCMVTGRVASSDEDVVPAHIGKRPGVGMKAGDDTVIPLLARIHQKGHQFGEMGYYFDRMDEGVLRFVWGFQNFMLFSEAKLGPSHLRSQAFRACLQEYAETQYRVWKDGGTPFEDCWEN